MSANEMRTEKYESTGETRILDDVVLHRIRALRSFGHIERGDIGGWIASVHNLHASGDAWVVGDAQVYGNAQVCGDALVGGNAVVYGDAQVVGDARVYGNAWVYGNARVYGNAQVCGDARVYGNAWVYGNARVYGNAQVVGDARVYGNAHYITLGPLGSRRSTLTICADAAIGWRYTTGCFSGSRAKLSAAVDKTHPSGCFRGEYEAAIAFADAWIAAHEVRA